MFAQYSQPLQNPQPVLVKPHLLFILALSSAVFANETPGNNQVPASKPLELRFSVGKITSSLDGETKIELSNLQGETAGGLLLTFIVEPGKDRSAKKESPSGEIERFLRFDPLPNQPSTVPGLIAKYVGVSAIQLFSGSAWWTGLSTSPERLKETGGNFFMLEGAYPAEGHSGPSIKLGIEGVFSAGAGEVTLKVWAR